MRIVVTEVTGGGSIRRGMLDTADPGDAGRCGDLIERATLDAPPPYRPVAGRPVYEICANDKNLWVAEHDLTGPLRDLVMITLVAGARSAGAAWARLPASARGMSPRRCRLLPRGTCRGHRTDRHHGGMASHGRTASPLPSACAARAGSRRPPKTRHAGWTGCWYRPIGTLVRLSRTGLTFGWADQPGCREHCWRDWPQDRTGLARWWWRSVWL